MRKAILLLPALLALSSTAAQAAPITFSYTGVVDFANYDPSFIDDPTGATFEGEYTFDSTATDQISGGTSGSYVGSSLNLTLLTETFSFGTVNIGVNNFPSPLSDFYLVGFANALTTFSMELEDLQRTVFISDALPLTPPSLALFERRALFFQHNDPGFNLLLDFGGTITSLQCVAGCGATPPDPVVPEPATLLLIPSGLAALAARRRTTRRPPL